ncbi:SAP domain-containing protein [Cryptosporidium andersoni]|uniref:SAP domain-containing protein n=1 Tax=Cryptosporidium andersoni TaxID=117008 RepID=A0A1J4MFM4_9CRYT|nr:SAP domain-containing protein [Cryptosporidium andersoni]
MNYNLLKIDDLKELLRERGLSVTGRKQQLIDALIEYDAKLEALNNDPIDIIEEGSMEKECSVIPSIDNNHIKSNKSEGKVSIYSIQSLSEKERIELRKQKFGTTLTIESEPERRLARIKRFGTNIEDDKKLLRAARFGIRTELDKIEYRKKRFGSTSNIINIDHKKKIEARKLRFGLK